MQRYNIALLPVDNALQQLFIECAVSYFGKSADGYLLGKEALAHITLSQFNAATDQVALDTYASWAENSTDALELALTRFNMRGGTAEHTGKFWAEFLVERKAALLKCQESCFNHLAQNDLKPLTSIMEYSPHITLARIATRLSGSNVPHALPIAGPIAFRSALGLSTENGVFIKKLTLV